LKENWGLYKDGWTGMLYWWHKDLNLTGWYPPEGWVHTEHSTSFQLEKIPSLLRQHQQKQAEWWETQNRISQREAKKGLLGIDINWKM
jgi:hypothetical protein